MENKIISYDELRKIIDDGIKKATIIFIVASIVFVLLSVWMVLSDLLYMIVVFGFFYFIILYGFIKMNTSFKKEYNELINYKDEIDTYCNNVMKNIYFTKDRILRIEPSFGTFKNIPFEDIKGRRLFNDGEGNTSVVLELKNKKTVSIPHSKKVIEELEKRENREVEKKRVESDLVKDFYVFDDYAEGEIYFPALGQSCYNYFADVDENIVQHAEEIAEYVKTFTMEDFNDALVSTVWSYNDFFRDGRYFKDLINAHMPVRVNEKEILKYMTFSCVYLEHLKDGSTSLVIGFEVPWEVEHGFSWVFKNKDLVYVGSGTDVDAGSSDSVLKGDWNYAKVNHEPVILSEEELAEIEAEYKECENNK